METPVTPSPIERPTGSWGAIISILLILGIVVAGAYYAIADRLDPPAPLEVETTY